LYISCKDEEGVVQDHPLRGFELEIEAKWYLEGYVDAIVNHTGDGKSDPEEVKGQFRISEIGEENAKQRKSKSN
jgi:hypothetical protein